MLLRDPPKCIPIIGVGLIHFEEIHCLNQDFASILRLTEFRVNTPKRVQNGRVVLGKLRSLDCCIEIRTVRKSISPAHLDPYAAAANQEAVVLNSAKEVNWEHPE